jgi:ABC-type multidrug transport system ATPase subunit
LLNILNFRNRANLKITGDVKINGSIIRSSSELSSISGYVQQEDMFIGYLKVKEQLKFQVIFEKIKSYISLIHLIF